MTAAKKAKINEVFVEGKTISLNSKKVKWASFITPDTRYEPAYKADVVLTKKEADEMKVDGFNIRQDTDGDWVLRVKKKVSAKDGTPLTPPRIVGRDGQTPFTENVGNGSICNLNVFCKYIEVAGKTHLPAYLNEVQVVDHVPYAGGSPGFGDVDEPDPDASPMGDDVPF